MGVEVSPRWPSTARSTSRPARKVDRKREYQPAEAIKLVKELKFAKMDETVEVHVRTGLNVRHADEQLRGTIALPHGLGKEVKIAVFARGDKAREAEEAGADYRRRRGPRRRASRRRASPTSTSPSRRRT